MNIYGDMGNIICLKQRCLNRGIGFEVKEVRLQGHKTIPEGDIYFMGGGQDNDMHKIFLDLFKNKKKQIENLVERNKVFLLICGGFQLFGEYFLDSQLREIKGLGILPITTKAPGKELKERCLGNMVAKINDDLLKEIKSYYKGELSPFLVGFENHSGQTYFTNDKVKPTSKVINGWGNNAIERLEGAYYRNIYASYMHGSLLPKNPHFADMLIGKALKNKYGKVNLLALDDSIEWAAHFALLKKFNLSKS